MRVLAGPLVRTFLLAAIAAGAAGYAIVRYYTHPRLPMVAPAPPQSASGEIPAPEVLTTD